MKNSLLTALVVFSLLPALHADFTVDRMFSDHMVLQRDLKVPVWGTADPGTQISVTFRDQTQSAKAGDDGKWRVHLEPLAVGEPGALSVTAGKRTMQFEDVLVGEVWIGSGQSNMAGRVSGYAKNDPVLAGWMESGPYPQIRLRSPRGWEIADAETIRGFSAILFSFGYTLQEELQVPVGLMFGAVGGTPSGRWMTPEMMAASPEILAALKAQGYASVDALVEANKTAMEEYQAEAAKLKAEGKKAPKFRGPIEPGTLYQRHIQPFAPYGIRGVLWDQGEARTQLPGVDQYTAMQGLIAGWREVWGQGDFPFLHVQKPSGGGPAWYPENPVNRGAQPFKAEYPEKRNDGYMSYPLDHIRMGTIQSAPLVTAMDLGTSVHPACKSGYGTRAMQVALGTVYGQDVTVSGPVYASHTVESGSIRVQFDHVGEGLAMRHAETILGFELAGADGEWKWADAKIDGDSVLVSNPEVPEPKAVRYAFDRVPHYANLYNQAGWPALQFTTALKE